MRPHWLSLAAMRLLRVDNTAVLRPMTCCGQSLCVTLTLIYLMPFISSTICDFLHCTNKAAAGCFVKWPWSSPNVKHHLLTYITCYIYCTRLLYCRGGNPTPIDRLNSGPRSPQLGGALCYSIQSLWHWQRVRSVDRWGFQRSDPNYLACCPYPVER